MLVAATNANRAAAVAAVEAMMDYLKTDAPFWKREMRGDGCAGSSRPTKTESAVPRVET